MTQPPTASVSCCSKFVMRRSSQSESGTQSESVNATYLPVARMTPRLRPLPGYVCRSKRNSRTDGNSFSIMSPVPSFELSTTITSNACFVCCAKIAPSVSRIVRLELNEGTTTEMVMVSKLGWEGIFDCFVCDLFMLWYMLNIPVGIGKCHYE